MPGQFNLRETMFFTPLFHKREAKELILTGCHGKSMAKVSKVIQNVLQEGEKNKIL